MANNSITSSSMEMKQSTTTIATTVKLNGSNHLQQEEPFIYSLVGSGNYITSMGFL